MPAGALKGGKSAGSPAKGGSGRAAGARPKVASGRSRKQSPKAASKGSPPQARRRSGKPKVAAPSAALAEEPGKEAQPGLGLRDKLEAAAAAWAGALRVEPRLWLGCLLAAGHPSTSPSGRGALRGWVRAELPAEPAAAVPQVLAKRWLEAPSLPLPTLCRCAQGGHARLLRC